MYRVAIILTALLCVSQLYALDLPLRIGQLTLTTPADYKHVVEKGIDSDVGHFVTPEGMKIVYDLGHFGGSPSRLPEMSKEELGRVVLFEDHPANAPKGFILVSRLDTEPLRPPVYFVTLALGKGVGSFGIQVTDRANLARAIVAIRAITIPE